LFKFPFKIPFFYKPDLQFSFVSCFFYKIDTRIPFPGMFSIPAQAAEGFRLTRAVDGFSPWAVN
ncbi:unnamed protein product, partial [Bubo scandiacus]